MAWRLRHVATAGTATFSLAAIAAVAASIAAKPDIEGCFGAGLALLMLAIARHDARHLIIPNHLTAASFVLGLASVAAAEPLFIAAAVGGALLRAAIAFAVFLAIKLGYRWWRGVEGIGMGDVKLAAAAGVWLDWLPLAVAVEMAVLAALAGYMLRQIIKRRPLRATGALPFGLYLAPSIWLGWLLQSTLLVP
jgi:leader peptidase (prepilin peptidase)/N-methyltransferase